MVNMNADLRSQIITMHNTKRNQIALGEMSRYRPAERMATVRWSPDLATLAEYNVKQCKLAEDPCHSTSKFKYSGQNLRLIQYSGLRTSRTNSELISTVINGWWNQHQHANQIVINSYPASWGGNDFTTMVQEYTWAVGCAIARYQSPDGTNNFLMNCYYAHMNRVNKPVYKRGTTASGCKTGKNVNYPGLCKVAEVYDLS
ncbi:CG3640, partial [Drosophila busckii]